MMDQADLEVAEGEAEVDLEAEVDSEIGMVEVEEAFDETKIETRINRTKTLVLSTLQLQLRSE